MSKEKISDIELVRLYNQKFNDSEIAKIINVSIPAVRYRRWKLGLLGRGINSKKASPQDLINTYNRRAKQHTNQVRIKGKIATLLRKEHPDIYNELKQRIEQKEAGNE